MTLPLRSLLFMPADSPRKIAKGAELPADAIIADLEDAVAPSRKQKARSLLVESFRTLPQDGPLRSIRINPVHSPFWPDDLLQTFAAAPRLYVIPKVESAADLQRVDEHLTPLESNAGMPVGSVRLLPIVESAAGVVNLPEIARADPRTVALAFGAEDFAERYRCAAHARGLGSLLRPQRCRHRGRRLRPTGYRHRLHRPGRRFRSG